MSALDKQVAGDHYKGRKIQPIELAYMLGQTPAFCKVAKYATRIKDDPIQQLEKAYHCIELDEELSRYHVFYLNIDYDEAEKLISDFTEDTLLCCVLKSMHLGYHNVAKSFLKDMIEREKTKHADE